MRRILALDVAGKIGVCEYTVGSQPIFYTKVPTSEFDDKGSWGIAERGHRALNWIVDRMAVRDIDDVVIEANIQGLGTTNSESIAVTLGLFSVISSVVMRHVKKGRCTLRIVSVSTVRVHVLGRGNGHLKGTIAKPAVRSVLEAVGWNPKNYDESDAGALAHWCAKEVGLGEMAPDLTPYHRKYGRD